jgi:hypothetical protein
MSRGRGASGTGGYRATAPWSVTTIAPCEGGAMLRVPALLQRWPRRAATSLSVGAAVLVLTATQASAVTTGSYNIISSSGASFQLLTTGNLANGVSDDQLYYLSTTGSGLTRLPFPLHLYNQTYQNAAISSNGNVQPGVTPGGANSVYANSCLPTSSFSRPAVMPFWDDLYFNTADTTEGYMEGIFLKTSGAAPHRKFLVSWQGHRFNDAGARVLAQAIFTEGSQTVTFVYGLPGGASATVGIQSKQQLSYTQWSCNISTAVSSGLKLTLNHSG